MTTPIKSITDKSEERLSVLEQKVKELENVLLPLFGKRRKAKKPASKENYERMMLKLIQKQSK
jgi:hypothetical protein